MWEIIIFWSKSYPDSFIYTVTHLVFMRTYFLTDNILETEKGTLGQTQLIFQLVALYIFVAVHFLVTQNAQWDPYKLVWFLVLSHSGTLICSNLNFVMLGLNPEPHASPQAMSPACTFSLYAALCRSCPGHFCFMFSGHNIMATWLKEGLYSWQPCCYMLS